MSGVWWHIPVIPVFKVCRQGEFKTSLGYIASLSQPFQILNKSGVVVYAFNSSPLEAA